MFLQLKYIIKKNFIDYIISNITSYVTIALRINKGVILMKKMVVFSLLVLCFPLVTFAETSEEVPIETIPSSQEQVVESVPVSRDTTIESTGAATSESQSSVEKTGENQELATTDSQVSVEETVGSQEPITKEAETIETAPVVDPSTETLSNEIVNLKDDEEKLPLEPSIMRSLTISTKKADANEIAEKSKPIVTIIDDYIITELKYPWQIREVLSLSKFGVSKSELDGYTDKDLDNAFSLFARYNMDIDFMDWNNYIRVLRLVYKDKVISWADAEKALTFESYKYKTTAELAKDIDGLQAYLHSFYSDKESLIMLRKFSNEELLHILDYLSGSEEELMSINGYLFSGLVHWLYYSQNENGLLDNNHNLVSPFQNFETTSTPIFTNLVSIPAPAATNLIADQKGNKQVQSSVDQKEYPKTGEKSNRSLIFAGTALFLISSSMILKKRELS